MTVPDEAIEAAAKAEYEHEWSALDGTWDATTKEARALFRQSAKVALEAAAPYLRAQALEDAADWLDHAEQVQNIAFDGPSDIGTLAAKYEAASEDPTDWLRARAAAERGPDV